MIGEVVLAILIILCVFWLVNLEDRVRKLENNKREPK